MLVRDGVRNGKIKIKSTENRVQSTTAMRITLFINVITRIIRFYYAGLGNLCHLFNLLIYFINGIKSRGSVITPVTAAAAATSGDARHVRAPGP